MSLDNITKIVEVGRGMFGVVYIGTDKKDNKYAIKVDKILPKHKKKNLEYPLWREIDFSKHMASLWPDQFMTLWDYKFVDACDFKMEFTEQKFDKKELKQTWVKNQLRLAKSSLCVEKMYDYVDTTYGNIIEKIYKNDKSKNKSGFIGIMIQVINIICLMSKEGYQHTDFHPGNMGVVYTSKKTVELINGIKIPTNGILLKSIDYGLVKHKKYKLSKKESQDTQHNYDVLRFITDYCQNEHYEFWKLRKSLDLNPFDEDFGKSLAKHFPTEFQMIEKIVGFSDKFTAHMAFPFMFPDKFQKHVLGKKYKKTYQPEFYIPYEAILFMLANIDNPEKILKYMLEFLYDKK